MEDYEKKYKEALERARQGIKDCGDNKGRKIMIYDIFPELAVSDDEKIRKELINIINLAYGCGITENRDKYIVWLERQSEEAKIEALRTEYEKGRADVLAEQKPEWSEEENTYLNYILTNCMHYADAMGYVDEKKNNQLHKKAEDWLKSLKDRVLPHPKNAWSEDDEKMRTRCAACLGYHYHDGMMTRKEYEEAYNWLKSLKERVQPQNTWKPSDKQMKQLGWVAEQNKDNMIGKELVSLYQDLKKLREE